MKQESILERLRTTNIMRALDLTSDDSPASEDGLRLLSSHLAGKKGAFAAFKNEVWALVDNGDVSATKNLIGHALLCLDRGTEERAEIVDLMIQINAKRSAQPGRSMEQTARPTSVASLLRFQHD